MMKRFHDCCFAFGLALLAFLVWKVGPGELLHELGSLGWGILPLIAIEGVVHLFHTQGWRHCLTGPLRSLSFFQIFRILMAGDSINYLTPTAGLGGELTKGALLSLNHQVPEAVTGVIVGKLALASAHLLYVVAGFLLVVRWHDLDPAVLGAMLLGILLVGAGIVGFLVVQKYGKLGAIIRWMVVHKMGGRRIEAAADQVNRVDAALQLFHRDHRKDLMLAVVWHTGGMVCGILQSWYFLRLLTGDASIITAAAISILGSWMDLLAFAIPVDIGVSEGTRVIVFRILGFSSALGLTYGVTVRLIQISWVGVGLLFYGAFLIEDAGLGLRTKKSGRTDGPDG